MAGEIQFSYMANVTCYTLVRNTVGQIWNNPVSGFAGYATGSYSGYVVSAAEQGAASAYYTATMPAAPPGSYNIVAKQQLGVNPAETDPTVVVGSLEWNGTAVAYLAAIPTSGTVQPIQLQKGTMVRQYPIYLKSSTDHITPFVSGIVSGQIARDGGAFGPLQSGAFTYQGNGFYALQALTSGDLNANTVSLLFTANNSSGGSSDPLPQTFIMQKGS